MSEIREERTGRLLYSDALETLRGADLSYANLYGADLRGAYLRGTRLSGATLARARMDSRTRRPRSLDPVRAGCLVDPQPKEVTPAAPDEGRGLEAAATGARGSSGTEGTLHG